MSIGNDTTLVTYAEIDRFPGYRFGNDGSVWTRHSRNGKGLVERWRQLHGTIDPDGYRRVNLSVDGKRKAFAVHRLILEAFRGSCPADCEACHNDGNRALNRLENLRWDTSQSNFADRDRHGTTARGERSGPAKLHEKDILTIRQLCRDGKCDAEVARMFGIGRSHVGRIKRHETWFHIP